MKNERHITRTIETTYAEVMTVNTETAEVKILTFTYGKGIADPLKYIRKHHETDTIKIVSIVSEKTETALYTMPERTFIEHATMVTKDS